MPAPTGKNGRSRPRLAARGSIRGGVAPPHQARDEDAPLEGPQQDSGRPAEGLCEFLIVGIDSKLRLVGIEIRREIQIAATSGVRAGCEGVDRGLKCLTAANLFEKVVASGRCVGGRRDRPSRLVVGEHEPVLPDIDSIGLEVQTTPCARFDLNRQ